MAKQLNKQDKNKTVLFSAIIAAVLVIVCVVAVIASNKKDGSKTSGTDGKEQTAGKEDGSSGQGLSNIHI